MQQNSSWSEQNIHLFWPRIGWLIRNAYIIAHWAKRKSYTSIMSYKVLSLSIIALFFCDLPLNDKIMGDGDWFNCYFHWQWHTHSDPYNSFQHNQNWNADFDEIQYKFMRSMTGLVIIIGQGQSLIFLGTTYADLYWNMPSIINHTKPIL